MTTNPDPYAIRLTPEESLKSAHESMTQLIRAAGQDLRLLGNKDWQVTMTHLNALINGMIAPQEQLKTGTNS